MKKPGTWFLVSANPFFYRLLAGLGTSTFHGFFQCGGVASSHSTCLGGKKSNCAWCIKSNVLAGRDPIHGCGDFTAFTLMDVEVSNPEDTYFPQIEAIEEIHSYYPDSVFILNLRPVRDFVRSVLNWSNLIYDLQRKFGWPDKNLAQSLEQFYLNHTKFIKDFAKRHNHKLLVVDITSENAAALMSKEFNITEKCWGHENKNPVITARDAQSHSSLKLHNMTQGVEERRVVFTYGRDVAEPSWNTFEVPINLHYHHHFENIPGQSNAADDQDRAIAALFNYSENEFYIELASAFPVAQSNTNMLERDLKWSGVCIEPQERYLPDLANRNCTLFSVVVGAERDEMVQMSDNQKNGPDATNGVLGDVYFPNSIEHSQGQMRMKESERNARAGLGGELITWRTTTFADLLERLTSVPKVIPYLSLDCEGCEPGAVMGFPFDKYTVLSMTVEKVEVGFTHQGRTYGTFEAIHPVLNSTLHELGYINIGSLGSDDLFVLKNEFDANPLVYGKYGTFCQAVQRVSVGSAIRLNPAVVEDCAIEPRNKGNTQLYRWHPLDYTKNPAAYWQSVYQEGISVNHRAVTLPETYKRCGNINPFCFEFGSPYSCIFCCNVNAGPRGDPNCFDEAAGYTFERCCLNRR